MHGVASFAAGLAAAITSTPVDTLKTRLMQQPVGPDGKGLHYRGMIDCATQTVKGEGVMGLYRGFIPTWFRIGPWAMIMFMSFVRCVYLCLGIMLCQTLLTFVDGRNNIETWRRISTRYVWSLRGPSNIVADQPTRNNF